MSEFIIATDTTTDLPDQYINENNLALLFVPYTLDGKTYDKETDLPYQEFYAAMRGGSMPTTSQVNPETMKEEFAPLLEDGTDILYIAFSSGLSGTYNSGRIAAEELNETYPNSRIVVVDSLCASMGEGLYVHKAVEMKKEGKSMDEIVEWLEKYKMNICQTFTVDDLHHLFRGGRVSKATAIVGTMINIKPILHVDEEGHLVAIGKVRGRKKSLNSLVDNMEKQMGSFRHHKQTVFISHGDCVEDAEYVRDLIRERFGFDDFMINNIGPTIGTHSGPGTVALFFMGDQR